MSKGLTLAWTSSREKNSKEWIKQFVDVRPGTKVLLILFQRDIKHLSKEEVMENLRHELGHALLYLRAPKAKNDCAAADEEWKRCTQSEDLIVRIPLGQLTTGE